MTLTLRQIRYYIATAETGSITAAARQVNVSQSVVTEAVKSLEAHLGTALMERGARGVRLTHEGHQFLRHARRIVAAVEDAENALVAERRFVEGTLNLGFTSLVAGYYLADLLARYRRAFPSVAVSVTEDERRYIEHLLVNGELDLAVMLVSNLENRQALEDLVLVRSPIGLWLPTRHPLLEQAGLQLADISDAPLIMLEVDEMERNLRVLWQTRGWSPNVVLRTRSVEAVRSLVATGAGLAILPELAFRPWSLEGDRLEFRPIDDLVRTIDVGVVWRRGSELSGPAAGFSEIAFEH